MSPKLLWVPALAVLAGCTAAPPPQAATPQAAAPTPTATKAAPLLRPYGDAARDHNPLNQVGKAKELDCHAPRVLSGSFTSMKKYLTAISGCLDRFWAAEFAEAHVVFTPPKRSFPNKVPKSFCEGKWTEGAGGTYCNFPGSPDHRRFIVPIRPGDLWPDYRLDLAIVVAHEYGHHIQEMSGYATVENAAYRKAPDGKRKAMDLITRRSELQTQCFAGIAMGAFYDSLFSSRSALSIYRRNQRSWDQEAAWDRDHGLPKTQLAWFERGFKARSTGACNTWRYPAGAVK